MSVIRSRRLAAQHCVGAGPTNVLTAAAGQTIVIDELTGIPSAGGAFDVWFFINLGASNCPGVVLPLRGVSNTGEWKGRIVMNAGDVLQCEPLNGGPGWVYDVGVFGFSLT